MSKVYPDKDKMRRQSHMACKAINDLTSLGIQVLSVSFRKPGPKIEVAHCPANKKLRSMLSGQGVNNNGIKYIRRSSIFSGCCIEWQEIKHG